MTIKESFEQYRYIVNDIENKKQELDKLRGFPPCISKSDAENRIICDIYKLIESKQSVEKIIDENKDPTLKRYLKLRYIDGLTLDQSAEKLGKSERHMRRLQKSFFEKNSKCP